MKKLNIFKCYHLIVTIWRIVIKMNTEYSLKGGEMLGMCTLPKTIFGGLLYYWLTNRCFPISRKFTSIMLPLMLAYESNNFSMNWIPIFLDYQTKVSQYHSLSKFSFQKSSACLHQQPNLLHSHSPCTFFPDPLQLSAHKFF